MYLFEFIVPAFYVHISLKDITVTGKLECLSWRKQGKQEHNVFNRAGERMAEQRLGGPRHWFYII